MSIRWDSESDWKNSQDSSGTTGRNGELKQGYSRDRPDLSSDLVGYWPLHDSSATDYSGNDNHGSLNGGITTGVAGKGGLQAMSFDGSDDFISVGSLSIGSSVTATAWVNLDERKSSENHTIGPHVDNGETQGFRIFTDSDTGEVGVWTRNDNSSVDNLLSSYLPPLDEWVFIAFTYDGSTGHLYANGEEVASGSMNANSFAGTGLIGRYSGSGYNLNGQQADVRLYNRSLSQSEIKTLYDWGSEDYARPPTDGIARYKMDGNVEDSWNSNDGTNNGVDFVSNSIRGQAGRFNSGETDSIAIPDNTVTNSDPWTVSTWVNLSSIPASGSNYVTSQFRVNGQWWMRIRDDKKWEFGWYDGSVNNVLTASTLSKNNWHHLTARWDPGGNATVYINGREENSRTTTTTDAGDMSKSSIGADRRYSQFYMDGILDDFRIYDYALSSEEIFELYRWGTRGRDMRKQLVNY